MIAIINKIISSVLVPIFMSPFLPCIHIAKLFNMPKHVISLSENNICTKDDPIYLTAHRGITAVAPENSIPSYEESVRLGFYSAECDIRLTKDNEWVLIHNSDVNGRFCEIGEVEELTFEEVRKFTYKNGSNFWKYKDLPMPTLDEYLDVFVGSKTRPQIEIKTETYDMLYTVVDSVVAKGLENSAIIISFDLKQLQEIHKLNSNIELWYLVDDVNEKNIAEAKAISDNVWLSANFEKNTKENIQLAIDNNIGVSFWTVNTLEDAKMLYDMGIRYFETDILCN